MNDRVSVVKAWGLIESVLRVREGSTGCVFGLVRHVSSGLFTIPLRTTDRVEQLEPISIGWLLLEPDDG